MKLGYKLVIVGLLVFFSIFGLRFVDIDNNDLLIVVELLVFSSLFLEIWGFHYIFRYYRFRKIFGTSSPSGRRDWQIQSAMQGLVDKILKEKAVTFEQDINDENACLKRAPKDPAEFNEFRKDLEAKKDLLHGSKKDFWRAHKLAKSFNFNTKPSFKDYSSL